MGSVRWLALIALAGCGATESAPVRCAGPRGIVCSAACVVTCIELPAPLSEVFGPVWVGWQAPCPDPDCRTPREP